MSGSEDDNVDRCQAAKYGGIKMTSQKMLMRNNVKK
jgi:hypothetical protein